MFYPPSVMRAFPCGPTRTPRIYPSARATWNPYLTLVSQLYDTPKSHIKHHSAGHPKPYTHIPSKESKENKWWIQTKQSKNIQISKQNKPNPPSSLGMGAEKKKRRKKIAWKTEKNFLDCPENSCMYFSGRAVESCENFSFKKSTP